MRILKCRALKKLEKLGHKKISDMVDDLLHMIEHSGNSDPHFIASMDGKIVIKSESNTNVLHVEHKGKPYFKMSVESNL